jgi:hypothetical protein
MADTPMSGAQVDNSNSVPNQIQEPDQSQSSGTPLQVNDSNNVTNVTATPSTVPTTTSDVPNQIPPPKVQTPLAKLNDKIADTPSQDLLPPKVHYQAKMINGIMDVLVPKQYRPVIQPDGSTKQVPLPRTHKDIGMALAMAAITGAFSGLGERGPGATGRAAAMGFNNVVQQREKVDQEQNQQASADFNRKQATLDFNMRLSAAARQAGMEDKAENDAVVSAFSPLVDSLESNPNSGDLIKFGSRETPLTEDEAEDIKKHSAFRLQRIPVSTVPRLDANGEQVWIGIDGKIVSEGTQGAHRAWDHGYILVDNNAKETLSDANGPKDWVKEGVTKWGGLVPGLSPSLLSGDGAKGEISSAAAGKMILQIHQLDTTQDNLDKYVDVLNEGLKEGDKNFHKPIDLKSAVKSGTVTLKDLQNLQNAAGNSSQGNSTVLNTQIDAIRAKDPKSANRLQALFGGDDLETYKQKVLAKGAATKAEEEKRLKGLEIHSMDDARDILAKNKANPGSIPADKVSEAQKYSDLHSQEVYSDEYQRQAANMQVQREEQQAQEARTSGPTGFRSDSKMIASMGPDQLQDYLKKNGVTIPSDFESLYSVGREYSDTLNKVFPTRVSKGTDQTDANHALNFIHKYINGNYNDANYDAGKRFLIQINDPKTSPVIGAGVATQHLDLLRNAGEALKNQNLVALNALAQSLGVATGKSAPVVFKAIADQVNQEVGKVVAGGQAYEADLKRLGENINRDQSPAQIDGVIKGYIGLMAGRLNELDFDSKRLFNHPLQINPRVTDLFNNYHQNTSWEEGSPRYLNGKLIGYTTDGKTLSRVVQSP